MRSIESTGRSIDEAIFHGLQQLEISIDGDLFKATVTLPKVSAPGGKAPSDGTL